MKLIKELLSYVVIIAVVLLIRSFLITPVRVNGASMEATLYDGDILFLEKFNHNFKRFDIVVINYNGERLIKRVIGLPGEHVKYVDNKLYINNQEIEEAFIEEDTIDYDLNSLNRDVIPAGYYFVMGDNRNNSVDSRLIGLISKNDINGTTNLRIFPFNKMGLLD